MILAFDVPISRTTTRQRPHRLYASRSTIVTSERVRVLLLVLFLVIAGSIHRTEAQSVSNTGNGGYEDEYAEFVQEVVEEDQDQHNGEDGSNDYATLTDQEYERQQEELLRRERTEQERIRQQEEDLHRRIQEEREMAFEAELAQLTDEKQKAAARKQKKRDAAIVQRILRHAAKGNLYAVLGLQYRNLFSFHLHIPGCTLTLPIGTYRMGTPEIDMLHFAVTPVHIKRAYRERARAVHPDKCRDGRAVEAFHAVEQAASILLHAPTRAAYDAQLVERRRAQRARVRQYLQVGWEQLGRIVRRVQIVFQLLGPFALPLSILTVWIF